MRFRHSSTAVLASIIFGSIRVAFAAQSADSKYDFGTTIFSPKGRLYQVEYASEVKSDYVFTCKVDKTPVEYSTALSSTMSCSKATRASKPSIEQGQPLGFALMKAWPGDLPEDEVHSLHSRDCPASIGSIVLCSLKTIYDTRLQLGNQREKTSLIDAHVICASAGLTADAMVLVRDCRASAQQHTLTFQELIPLQKLAGHVADVKQAYTQHGGLRPWGVSLLLAGWDHSRGFQLYKTEPSGNFGAYKAVVIGAGASRLSAELASGYRNAGGSGMGLPEAIRLAAGVLDRERNRLRVEQELKRGGSDDYSGIGMEIATMAVMEAEEEQGQGRISASAYVYSDEEVENVLMSLGRHDHGEKRGSNRDQDLSSTGGVGDGDGGDDSDDSDFDGGDVDLDGVDGQGIGGQKGRR